MSGTYYKVTCGILTRKFLVKKQRGIIQKYCTSRTEQKVK